MQEWLQDAIRALGARPRQRGQEDSSDEMMRRPASAGGSRRPPGPSNSGTPSGLEFAVTAFSARVGDGKGARDEQAALMAELLDCLPPDLRGGSAVMRDGAVAGSWSCAARRRDVTSAPDVRLVFPPCVPCGEEITVEIHMGPRGCDYRLGVKVVGTIDGKVFMEESARGAGSVLRVRIPELQPGIVNFLLTGKGEDQVALCNIAPLAVLPKASADDGVALFCKLVDAMCRPGAVPDEDQKTLVEQTPRVVFVEGSAEERVWDKFASFLLEMEAILTALNCHSVSEPLLLEGSAWELVLCNLICYMAELDAWELICFLVGRCVAAKVIVDIGGFVPAEEDLTSGSGLKAQVLGRAVCHSRSPSPGLCVADVTVEGRLPAFQSPPPAPSDQQLGCQTQVGVGAPTSEFSYEEACDSVDWRQDVEDEGDVCSVDSDEQEWLLGEVGAHEYKMAKGNGVGEELKGIRAELPLDDGPQLLDHLPATAPVASVGMVAGRKPGPQTPMAGKAAAPAAADSGLGRNFDAGHAPGQKSEQADSLVKRFQQLVPDRALREAKRNVGAKATPEPHFAPDRAYRAQIVDLNGHDDDQALSGSSLVSSTVPSSLTCTDNADGSMEIPTPREASPGVLHSMSRIVRRVLGLKASRHTGGGAKELEGSSPTRDAAQGSDAHLGPAVPKAESGYLSWSDDQPQRGH